MELRTISYCTQLIPSDGARIPSTMTDPTLAPILAPILAPVGSRPPSTLTKSFRTSKALL